MRFLKVFLGLAVAVTVLTGCGGGSDSAPATSSSVSSAAPTSTSGSTSSSTSSSTSPASTGSSSTSPPTGSSSPSPPPANKGTATLSWTAPTANSDGSALTDLAGYHIHYGTSASSLSNEIDVSSAGTVTYQVTNLATGTWYFAVTSYTTSGLESPPSSVVSKTIS